MYINMIQQKICNYRLFATCLFFFSYTFFCVDWYQSIKYSSIVKTIHRYKKCISYSFTSVPYGQVIKCFDVRSVLVM